MTLRFVAGGLAAAGLCLAMSTSARQPRLRPVETPPSAPQLPELPRRSVDITNAAPTGRTIHVAAGENLQAAIDDARAGDVIALEPGATYRGPFRLPRKAGDG